MRESSKLNYDSNNIYMNSAGSKRKLNDDPQQEAISQALAEGGKMIGDEADAKSSAYGPLTQRLISALIEQNLMTPFDTDIFDSNPRAQHMSPRTLAKSLSGTATNSAAAANTQHSLEKKIRKELIEHGILDKLDLDENFESNDENDEAKSGDNGVRVDKDDEIALEIKRLHDELKLVSGTCKKTQVQLLGIAKKVMLQQSIQKKAQAIDQEIKELFIKSKQMKAAKKPLCRKDKERSQKLLKEREVLKNELAQFHVPNVDM